jgi:hypothetical protein
MAFTLGPIPPDAPAWLIDILRNMERAQFDRVQVLRFKPLGIAPTRPTEGDLARADGVGWNPGAGAGLYEYRAGAWAKL